MVICLDLGWLKSHPKISYMADAIYNPTGFSIYIQLLLNDVEFAFCFVLFIGAEGSVSQTVFYRPELAFKNRAINRT